MQTTDIAQIAATLTKAQRACVMVLSDEFQRPPRGHAYWAATMTYGYKLTQFRYETWDSRNRIYRLTPLGQQVRALLQETPNDA